jgi:hypothetical protein
MLPTSMQFQGSTAFQPLNDPSVVNSQSYDAHQPAFGQPIEFTLTGSGQLPEEPAQGGPAQPGAEQGGGGGAQTQTAASGQRPGGGLGAPIDPEGTNDPWSKYKWWILTVLGLALAAGAAVMLKSGQGAPATAGAPLYPETELSAPNSAAAGVYAPGGALPPGAIEAPALGSAGAPGSLLQALKEELFALEMDRLVGRLTETEYAEHKAAFDVVLRRALARIEA